MTNRHGERPDTPITEPAPTITSKARSDVWVVDRRTNSKAAGGGMTETVPVPMDRPAPTLTGKAGGQWVFHLPATTYQVRSGDYEGTEPIKLTVAEAAALQSFRPDYPWQGTRSKQFEQIGNAVPPVLAAAVLGALLGGSVWIETLQ